MEHPRFQGSCKTPGGNDSFETPDRPIQSTPTTSCDQPGAKAEHRDVRWRHSLEDDS